MVQQQHHTVVSLNSYISYVFIFVPLKLPRKTLRKPRLFLVVCMLILEADPTAPLPMCRSTAKKRHIIYTVLFNFFRRQTEWQMIGEIWKRKQNAQRRGKQGDRWPGVELRWLGWDDQPDLGQRSRNLAGLNPVTCDLIFSPPSDRSLRVELCIINLPPNRLPSTLMIASLCE